MSEQDGTKAITLQRPTTHDPEVWTAYWKVQSQPWRTEPEIDTKRQKELAQRLTVILDIKQGIYPFKDMKLSRADIEWLLSTHKSRGIRGPVDCSDKRQQTREGLDLRGANLQGEDLSGLPLARIRGGLTFYERFGCTEEQREMAAVHLQKAKLLGVNLQEAILGSANLQSAIFGSANLQKAFLGSANLQEAYLMAANLQEAYLGSTNLQEVDLEAAQLQEANLIGARLKGANLKGVTLGNEKQVGPQLADSQWSEVNLSLLEWSQVKILGDEHVARQKKDSQGKIKEKQKSLSEYESAVRANRQLAVILRDQGLNEKADHFAYLAQVLQQRVLWLKIGEVQWIERLKDKVQQTSVWKLFTELWQKAHQSEVGKRLEKLGQWIPTVWVHILKLMAFVFSVFLNVLAGYGYKPGRTLFWYVLIISGFAWAYYLFQPANVHLSSVGAVIFSITAFHGRGFFSSGDLGYDSLITILGAVEAVIGLLIELSFIATFTQRFFGK